MSPTQLFDQFLELFTHEISKRASGFLNRPAWNSQRFARERFGEQCQFIVPGAFSPWPRDPDFSKRHVFDDYREYLDSQFDLGALRELFEFCWDNKRNPDKGALRSRIRAVFYFPFEEDQGRVDRLFENVVTAWETAIGEMRVSEHSSAKREVPDLTISPVRPGRRPTAKINERRWLVHEHILAKGAWTDREKVKQLFKDLDKHKVPLPKSNSGLELFPGVVDWSDFLSAHYKKHLKHITDLLDRDRWPRSKPRLN